MRVVGAVVMASAVPILLLGAFALTRAAEYGTTIPTHDLGDDE